MQALWLYLSALKASNSLNYAFIRAGESECDPPYLPLASERLPLPRRNRLQSLLMQRPKRLDRQRPAALLEYEMEAEYQPLGK